MLKLAIILFKLISYFFTNSSEEDPYTLTRLQSVKCVKREDNSLVTAQQCYDPTDSLLTDLLLGEQLFPHADFCQPQVIESLKLLGMSFESHKLIFSERVMQLLYGHSFILLKNYIIYLNCAVTYLISY